MTPAMRARLEFFVEHAGYSTPPGRMVCARDLARAEVEGSKRGWLVEWSPDCDCDREWSGNEDCPCGESRARAMATGQLARWECFCESAVLWSGRPDDTESPESLGALGGICSASSNYRRVVNAELMLEALAGEWLESERYTSLLERIAS